MRIVIFNRLWYWEDISEICSNFIFRFELVQSIRIFEIELESILYGVQGGAIRN